MGQTKPRKTPRKHLESRGAETSSKKGVLILESTTQAMVLPQVFEPHLNINGAIAGTIVYDTSCDMLAVYDGVNWSYWK